MNLEEIFEFERRIGRLKRIWSGFWALKLILDAENEFGADFGGLKRDLSV